jgi:hypothetical protein
VERLFDCAPRYCRFIRVASGRVVSGKVEIEDQPFEDGTTVIVIAADESETFELGPEDEAELLARIAELDRGDFVDGTEFIAKPRKRR